VADGVSRKEGSGSPSELRDASAHLLVQIRQETDALRQSGIPGSRELLEELGAVIEEIQAIVDMLERRPGY